MAEKLEPIGVRNGTIRAVKINVRFHRSVSYLNIAILRLLLETSTDYRLTFHISFSTVAGLAVSCVLAIICLCGKECRPVLYRLLAEFRG